MYLIQSAFPMSVLSSVMTIHMGSMFFDRGYILLHLTCTYLPPSVPPPPPPPPQISLKGPSSPYEVKFYCMTNVGSLRPSRIVERLCKLHRRRSGASDQDREDHGRCECRSQSRRNSDSRTRDDSSAQHPRSSVPTLSSLRSHRRIEVRYILYLRLLEWSCTHTYTHTHAHTRIN